MVTSPLPSLNTMPQEPQAIEVEVVEIDGVAPPAPFETQDESPQRHPWRDWQSLQGRVIQLDKRWWPLWALLSVLAIALLLTVGVVIGILYLIFRILRGIARAIFG
jgi:hypothetical protein